MNLQEIKEREAKATPGPWLEDFNDDGFLIVHPYDQLDYPTIICGFGDAEDTEQIDHINASFIAHAREDVPALVAEVERLHTEIDQVLDYYSIQVERLQAENERMRTVLEAYYAFSVDPNYAIWPEKNFTDRLNAITEAADAALKGKDYEIPAELRSNHPKP
jgi:hypothetical protein